MKKNNIQQTFMCKHTKNFEIIEIMHASHSRRAINGQPDELDQYGRPIGFNEIEDIQYYLFRCNDCNVERKFKTLAAEKPIYIKTAIGVLFP